jgi:hypothetical protein
MLRPILVVSHPPHGDVNLAVAAPLLGLTPVDLRLKLHYPVPEIWIAEEAGDAAGAVANELFQAGFSTVVIPGAALAEIPDRTVVPFFNFEADGLALETASPFTLPYDMPLIAVRFSARVEEATHVLPPSFLDVYAVVNTTLRRWTFLQTETGFAGLRGRVTASFSANVKALVTELVNRFPKARIDHRLVNMQVRRRVGSPPPGVQRRGYSFATAALHELLEIITPGLSGIEHQELASRLAFLTMAAS